MAASISSNIKSEDNTIQLGITKQDYEKIAHYCELMHKFDISIWPLSLSLEKKIAKKLNTEFGNLFKDESKTKHFFEIMRLANYLEITPLLKVCIQKIHSLLGIKKLLFEELPIEQQVAVLNNNIY